jgi:hypothetical protein
MRLTSRVSLIALALAFALGLAGCSSSSKPAAPTAPALVHAVMPEPATPTLAVQDIKWVMEKLDPFHYGELFTGDFVFAFGPSDPVGNSFPGRALLRAEELQSANHLIGTGTSTHAKAVGASLQLTGISVFDDARPGKDPGWHQEVHATAQLTIDLGTDQIHVEGPVIFYTVRGDSAQIPPDLVAEGFGPSSSRWWIERWEDRTGTTLGSTAIQGTKETLKSTWGALKAKYLE